MQLSYLHIIHHPKYHTIMKQNINFSKLLFLLFLAFTISSCHKDELEPDLVPITMTGENTMGFYVDGVPHNIRGVSNWSTHGVSGGITQEGVVRISGWGKDPKISIAIRFIRDESHKLKEYSLNGSSFQSNWVDVIDNAPLGGNIYNCDSAHTGKIKLINLEKNQAAGTFEFTAINEESGKIIHVTDGRFDIKFF